MNQPQFPIYIISKGRWESRYTSKALEAMNVPYWIVVEPQEYSQYANVIEQSKILTLPFSNLGQGSIPARNWVWDHASSSGSEWHWILDDNIERFYRFHQNRKVKCYSGAIFRAAEEFAMRYEAVAQFGFNYSFFIDQNSGSYPPFYLNTRIYSCICINNNAPFRWRGRYNEDTDLSLRMLKAGYRTILFNAFLARKAETMTMSGGNTDQLYVADGRKKMAQSLAEQHPDVARVSFRWGRPQHYVDYRPFKKNRLILKPDSNLRQGVNEFGMVLSPDPNCNPPAERVQMI